MSSISFSDAVKSACYAEGKTLRKAIEEMNKEGIRGSYNYVHQVFKKQRNSDNIVNWFRNRFKITANY